MLKDTEIVKVKNRAKGRVGYSVPDLGVRRVFAFNETKSLTADEIRKLSYVPGGEYLLKNCLIIQNEELVKEILGEVEPEYYYTEREIKELLLRGSLDQLYDCLDFAPEGVIHLVKTMAADLEINDVKKRKAILEKTDYDIDKVLEIREELRKDEEEPAEAPKRRVVDTKSATQDSKRRAAQPVVVAAVVGE